MCELLVPQIVSGKKKENAALTISNTEQRNHKKVLMPILKYTAGIEN